MLGFLVGGDGRKPDPPKTEQLRQWPEYVSCADITSLLCFAQYLREFLGPDFLVKSKLLRQYSKKGIDFRLHAKDETAHQSRQWLTAAIVDDCVLVAPC